MLGAERAWEGPTAPTAAALDQGGGRKDCLRGEWVQCGGVQYGEVECSDVQCSTMQWAGV